MADEGKPTGKEVKPEEGKKPDKKPEESGFKFPKPGFSSSSKSEGTDKKVGVGDRKPKAEGDSAEGGGEAGGAGGKAPAKKGGKKSASLGPLFKKETGEHEVWTNKSGPDDKSFVSVLQGKASVEALSGSYDLDKKSAKLTVVEAKAEGSIVHGQVDLVDKIKNFIFGADPKPPAAPPAPTTPMAARVGDLTMHVGPLAPGPGSSNVFIGGMPAWRIGLDLHLCPAPGVPHGTGPSAPGSPTVLINGAPAARATDFVVEPTGGPDVIALGCPTVFIGLPTPPPKPSPPPKAAEDNPWMILESVAEGDVGKVEASAKLGAEADLSKMKGKAEIGIEAKAALLRAELPLKLRIRIPFTSYYLGLGVKVEGTLGSLGVEAGAGVTVNEGKTLFGATGGLGAHAGIGGVGTKFGLDISKK